MAVELDILDFVKTLPMRDQEMYFLVQAYRNYLFKFADAPEDIRWKARSIVSKFYEDEVNRITGQNQNNQNIQNISNQNMQIKNTISTLTLIDNELDEKFGPWASSFSVSDDEDNISQIDILQCNL